MPDVSLFVGPTGHQVPRSILLDGSLELHPPVRRGDIDALTATKAPGVVIVCDGVFQCEPAVSHAELCRALDGGWQVWGVSSIGAIRAHELRAEGMHGFGYVYSLFQRFDDFTDDEMCLLHFPEEPYFSVSEPLVNLRYALELRGGALGISEASQALLLSALQRLWFGDRTLPTIRQVMLGEAGIEAEVADELLGWLAHNPAKSIDLIDLLRSRPWLSTALSPARPAPGPPPPT